MSENFTEINVNIKKGGQFISVRKSIIIDKTKGANALLVNEDELAVIVALSHIVNKRESVVIISPKTIYHVLLNELYINDDRRYLSRLTKGLQGIINKGIITVVSGLDGKLTPKSDIKIDISNLLIPDDDNFIGIDLREVRRIMSINSLVSNRVYRNKMLMLFLVIVETINSHDPTELLFMYDEATGEYIPQFTGNKSLKKFEQLYSFRSLDGLAELCHAGKDTVDEYLNILQDIKLIYIKKHGKYITGEDGRPHKLNNWYCRYQNREYIDGIATVKYDQIDYAKENVSHNVTESVPVVEESVENTIPVDDNVYWGEPSTIVNVDNVTELDLSNVESSDNVSIQSDEVNAPTVVETLESSENVESVDAIENESTETITNTGAEDDSKTIPSFDDMINSVPVKKEESVLDAIPVSDNILDTNTVLTDEQLEHLAELKAKENLSPIDEAMLKTYLERLGE